MFFQSLESSQGCFSKPWKNTVAREIKRCPPRADKRRIENCGLRIADFGLGEQGDMPDQ